MLEETLHFLGFLDRSGGKDAWPSAYSLRIMPDGGFELLREINIEGKNESLGKGRTAMELAGLCARLRLNWGDIYLELLSLDAEFAGEFAAAAQAGRN